MFLELQWVHLALHSPLFHERTHIFTHVVVLCFLSTSPFLSFSSVQCSWRFYQIGNDSSFLMWKIVSGSCRWILALGERNSLSVTVLSSSQSFSFILYIWFIVSCAFALGMSLSLNLPSTSIPPYFCFPFIFAYLACLKSRFQSLHFLLLQFYMLYSTIVFLFCFPFSLRCCPKNLFYRFF